jgi:hypothetical protein
MLRLTNYGTLPFSGWVRTTTDATLPESGHFEVGGLPRASFVSGRPIGLGVQSVDIRIDLAPGETVALAGEHEAPGPYAILPPPADPLAFFGGLAKIGGVPFVFVALDRNGASYDVHLRARAGMFAADLWLAWYPDQPGWASGEIVVTCSNPTLPDIAETVPDGFTLAFGNAMVMGCPDLSGQSFADGQARGFPLTLVWPQHLVDQDYSSASLIAQHAICARGLSSSWVTGNPVLAGGESAKQWTIANWGGALSALNGWSAHGVGVLADSHSTGKEGDQVFTGGPEAQLDGLGAEKVRYFAALGQLRRTTHHLEADGSHLNIDGHPSLVMWDGMPHYDPRQSPDQLGKSRRPNLIESHGWSGNWEEHWLINGLATAYRETGSRAIQWELEHQARQFLAQVTLDRTKSTTRPGASRAVGWRGLVAYHLWHCLDDRALAEQVRQRWRDHVMQVLIPVLGQKPHDIWQVQVDPRLDVGTGTGTPIWMPYQQSVGAYGLDLACEHLGPPEGRALALRGAKAVMDLAFDASGDSWSYVRATADVVGPLAEKAGAVKGDNVWIWNTVGIATVLRHEPENERAQALWTRIVVKQRGGGQWIPPEMVGR